MYKSICMYIIVYGLVHGYFMHIQNYPPAPLESRVVRAHIAALLPSGHKRAHINASSASHPWPDVKAAPDQRKVRGPAGLF